MLARLEAGYSTSSNNSCSSTPAAAAAADRDRRRRSWRSRIARSFRVGPAARREFERLVGWMGLGRGFLELGKIGEALFPVIAELEVAQAKADGGSIGAVRRGST